MEYLSQCNPDSLESACHIQLPGGKVAIVDADDFAWLSKWKWRYHVGNSRSKGYVVRYGTQDGKQVRIAMHRLIIGALADQKVDHINGNTLDNRRSNLRLATPQQNARNSRKRTRQSSSQYRGVTWHKHIGKWQVMIKSHAYHNKYIGLYVDEREAAKAYDAAARELHGEFACLNFPDGAPV